MTKKLRDFIIAAAFVVPAGGIGYGGYKLIANQENETLATNIRYAEYYAATHNGYFDLSKADIGSNLRSNATLPLKQAKEELIADNRLTKGMGGLMSLVLGSMIGLFISIGVNPKYDAKRAPA